MFNRDISVISNQCEGVVHGGNVIIKNNKDNCGDLLSFAEPSSVVFDHTKNCSYCRCGAFERNFGTGEGGRGQEYEKLIFTGSNVQGVAWFWGGGGGEDVKACWSLKDPLKK